MSEIRWAVKPSLLAYMQRDSTFSVELDGGATFDGAEVVLPAVANADGSYAATGTAVLGAHGGMLLLPLTGLVVADGAVVVHEEVDGVTEAMRLVTLSPVEGEASVYDTTLTDDAVMLFLQTYPAGTPFGRLVVDASA